MGYFLRHLLAQLQYFFPLFLHPPLLLKSLALCFAPCTQLYEINPRPCFITISCTVLETDLNLSCLFSDRKTLNYFCNISRSQGASTQDWYKTDDGLLEVDLSSGKTRSGLELKIDSIPNSILNKKEKFFACLQCGAMAWIKT